MLIIHNKPIKYNIDDLSFDAIRNLLCSLNFNSDGILYQYESICEYQCEEKQRLHLLDYLKNEVNKSLKQICFNVPGFKECFWVDTIFNHNNIKQVSSYSEFIECYVVDGKKYEYSLIDQQWCYRDNILPFKKNKEFEKYRRVFRFLETFYIHVLIRKLDNLDPDIISNIFYYYYKIIELPTLIFNISFK